MQSSVEQLRLDRIGLSSPWSLHPWDLDSLSNALQRSFETLGILHPPVVRRKADTNGYEIVSGARRIQYLRHNALSVADLIICRVVGDESTEEELLELVLEEQICSQNDLSLAEKARFLQIAGLIVKGPAVLERFGPRLRLKNGRRFLEVLTENRLDERIFRAMHQGVVDEKVLGEILLLRDRDDQLVFVELATSLGIGEGKQRRLLDGLRDVALKNGVSLARVLTEPEIAAILEGQNLNNPQRYQHLIDFLQKALHPASTAAEQRFRREVEQLALPAGYQIAATPAFERDEVTLTIHFESLEACRKHLCRSGLVQEQGSTRISNRA
jgi:hypothetical protein